MIIYGKSGYGKSHLAYWLIQNSNRLKIPSAITDVFTLSRANQKTAKNDPEEMYQLEHQLLSSRIRVIKGLDNFYDPIKEISKKNGTQEKLSSIHKCMEKEGAIVYTFTGEENDLDLFLEGIACKEFSNVLRPLDKIPINSVSINNKGFMKNLLNLYGIDGTNENITIISHYANEGIAKIIYEIRKLARTQRPQMSLFENNIRSFLEKVPEDCRGTLEKILGEEWFSKNKITYKDIFESQKKSMKNLRILFAYFFNKKYLMSPQDIGAIFGGKKADVIRNYLRDAENPEIILPEKLKNAIEDLEEMAKL